MPRSAGVGLPSVVATRVLRRHLWRYLAVVGLVQGIVLLLAMPLLGMLFDLAMSTVDVDAINLDSLGSVLTSPATVVLLVVFAAAAVACVFAELAVLTACAVRHLDGRPVTAPAVAGDLRDAARRLLGPAALLFVLYAVFLLPLTNVGVTSVVTEHVAVPEFICGELTKTTSGAVLWWGLMALLLYAALRLSLTLAYFVDGRGLGRAMAESIRQTGWVPWPPALAFLALALAVGVSLLIVGGLAVLVTALTGWAAFSLALVQVAHFVVLGLAAAWFTLFLAAWQRRADREPDVVPVRLPRRTRASIAASVGAVVALAVVALTLANHADMRELRDPTRTTVVGHRGYTGGGVENSIPALEAAASAGADVVEMDVLETRDQQLVVMHDTNLKRLADRDVSVADTDAADVVGLPIRQGSFTATIPSFDEYAAEAERLGIRLLVELKPHGEEAPGFAQRVVDAFDRLDVPDDWYVQSLDRGLVEEVEALDPAIETGYVVPFNVGGLPATSADFVVVEDWSYSDRLGREGEDAGRPVWVWTVNKPGLIRDYLHRGVAGLITDRVPLAVTDRDLAARIESPVGLLLDGIRRELGPRS